MYRSTGFFCWVAVCFSLLHGLTSLASANQASQKLQKQTKYKTLQSQPISKTELRSIASKAKTVLRPSANKVGSQTQQTSFKSLIDRSNSGHLGLSLPPIGAQTIGKLRVVRSKTNGTPVFISGDLSGAMPATSSKHLTVAGRTILMLEQNKSLFLLDSPTDELAVVEEHIDRTGKKHVNLEQMYHGIPVWGKEITVHLDATNTPYLITGRYTPTPTAIDTGAFTIGDTKAIEIAMTAVSSKTRIEDLSKTVKNLLEYESPSVRKYIWVDGQTETPYLVWHIEIRPNLVDHWFVFVDAVTGQVLDMYNNTKHDGPVTAVATDLNAVPQTINVYQQGSSYYMIDASRPMFDSSASELSRAGVILTRDAYYTDLDLMGIVTSLDNTWNDPTSVSAHYNTGIAFEYYSSTFGRNAIDDSGSTMISVIHVTKNGQSSGHASWNGWFMSYGDGDASVKPLAGGLDVAAHEMTHGVIDYTVKLEYKYQSGALNESFADVFGCMVDRDDWLIGEDVVRESSFPSGAMRDMADPHNGVSNGYNGWQPAHMSEFDYTGEEDDHGGVHVNSGIPNKAAYLIGTAIGKDKLEQIYYHILDARYLSRQAEFIDMRLAAIQSTTDMYGNPSPEVDAVTAAFDAVGIYDGTGTEQPPDIDPIIGDEWIAVVNDEAGDHSLQLVSTDIISPEIRQLTTTQVNTLTGCALSVSSDGTAVIFVDDANFIRAVATEDSQELVLSSTGEWSSVALSPDGTRLAVTSIYADASIYIFDLLEPDSSKVIELYSPTTGEGVQLNTIQWADALDWNSTGEFILFDAYHVIPQSGGGELSTWDVNLVEVITERVLRLFPPLRAGIEIGNPSFGSTNDVYVVFDLIDDEGQSYILGANLFSGNSTIIENNGTSPGYPRYSNDDREIIFENRVGGYSYIRRIPLDSTKISVAGPSFAWLGEALRPYWFVIPSTPGCCVGVTGNVDGDLEQMVDIGDVQTMIVHLFLTLEPFDCHEEADLDYSGLVDIGDLTIMIQTLFITLAPFPDCP